MGKTSDKRKIFRYLLEALVLQVWLLLLRPRVAVSEENQVLQHCNLSTKATVLLPFNQHYRNQEVLQGNLTVHLSNTDFTSGIHGEPGGAIELKGHQDSYVEIEANQKIHFNNSVTILCHIYPLLSQTGPIVHYKADDLEQGGIMVWMQGGIGGKSQLQARFKPKNGVLSSWMKAAVLNIGEWNFIGVSYDHVTGYAYLFHDGVEVQKMQIGKNKHLATQYEIRIGAMSMTYMGQYKGKFACLQFYSKALQVHEIETARDACMPVVPLQFLYLNLTSPAHVAEVNETMLTVKASANDNVTKPVFRFDWGDGMLTEETSSNTAHHMYQHVGTYKFHVQAWSLCNTSTLNKTANISVPTPVQILNNVSLQSEATVFGETTQLQLFIGQGSDFRCLWSLGDQVNVTTTSNHSGIFFLNHTYSSPDDYEARVTCWNRRSEISVGTTIPVQSIIKGLRIYPIPPILFGDGFQIRWRIQKGTAVTFEAHFSNMPLQVEIKPDGGLYGQAWVTEQEYKNPGEYYVHVGASNAVTKWISASAKCNIFQAITPFTPVLRHKARDIEINETITIWFPEVSSASGTNVSYHVTFGDDSKAVFTRSRFVAHAYGLHGLYMVNITATNDVSSFNTSIVIKVHKPVLKLEGASISSLVAKVNQNATIAILFLQGSDFDCHWEFGDGQELKQSVGDEMMYFKDLDARVEAFINISISTRHVFKRVGVYKVDANCQNRLSNVTATAYVTVQKEVELFEVSTVGPVSFGKTFYVNWTIASGTNVTFKAFLNLQDLDIENHDLFYMSPLTPSIYKQPGKYNITVTAENLVTPVLHHTQVVSIEIPVAEVHVNTSYLEEGIKHPGHGKHQNFFPSGVPVVFEATIDNGSSLHFTWLIHQAMEQFQSKRIEYIFNTPGIYPVTVSVENQLSRAVSGLVIAVQERASFFHGGLECSSPMVKKEIVTVRPIIEILGTNATLLIEVDNGMIYWYGDPKNHPIPAKDGMTMQYQGELKNSILHHVFDTKGVYNITAILSNDVSRSSATCTVEILPRPCKKPEIKLKSVGSHPKSARHFLTMEVVDIDADIDVFCPESKGSTYEWNISRYHPETGLFRPFGNVLSYGEVSMQELQLRKRALPLGLFKLSLTVEMVGEDLQNFSAVADGYIQIVQSNLVAKISGESEILRRFGSILFVDGLDSYDPDVGPRNYSGMSFAWLCRNTSESFPEQVAGIINGTVDIGSDLLAGFSNNSGQGCYRDGKFLLSNSTKLELTTSRMMPDVTYEIVLVIRKGNRTSSTTQMLELSTEHIPKLTLRCVVNCGQKVNPSSKLSLTTICTGSACTNELLYSWSLFVLETHGGKKPTWQRDDVMLNTQDIPSSGSFPNIVITKNKFQGNKHYKLVLMGTLPTGFFGRASYAFQVNAPPRDGTCNVYPRVGHVLTTEYKVWCAGWHDPDGPIKYEISYVRGIQETLLSYGEDAEATISPPLGEGKNYTIYIAVRISDKLGAAAVVKLQVQSLPPLLKGNELTNQLSGMTSGSRSPLESFLKSGKIQKLANMVGRIISVLNHQAELLEGQDSDVFAEEKKKIQDTLIMALTHQRATTLKAVQMVSGPLFEATQDSDEISLKAQEASTSALEDTATVFDRESRETGSNSMDTAAASVCGAIGNLLGAASNNAAVNQVNGTNMTSMQKNEQEAKQLKSKTMVKKLFNVLDSVARSLLRGKVAFEDATEISTPRLTLNLKCTTTSDTGGEVKAGFANFNIPKGNEMFGKAKPGLTSVNQKVFSTPKNYHTYHKSSKEVSSPVVSLSYEDKDNEKPIKVSNLKNYIEYFLPAPAGLPEADKFSVNVTDDTWAYHKLVVSSKDQAASIEVTPYNCSHKLHLYVRKDRHPTKKEFTWKKVIWQPSSEDRSNMNYAACFKDYSSYTVFIPNKKLQNVTYFIGIWYEGGKEDLRNSNQPVAMKYAIRVYKSKCLYWNKEKERWMGDGCLVGPLTNPKMIHCKTNHLTSFGSGMFVAPNPIDFRKALAGFAEAFQSGNVVVMFTIITLLIVYAVLAVWAWRADRRDAMQIGATIIPTNRPNSNYQYEIYFVTGSRNGSGTTAHVGCEIFGESDNSGPCYLQDSRRQLFRRGDLNVFIISLPRSLGVIREMRIWHDNSGTSPSWFLNRAMLRDCQTGGKWIFLAGRWLDVAEEDGKVDIHLRPATEQDMISFKKVFNTKIRKEICDNHLWFSVAYRPARSPFTRLQRLSCCLSLLFSFMVATAMFYGSGPQPGDTSDSVQMGPIKINMRMVIIGIESALVVVPVNILIVALFRNSRAKDTRPRKQKRCCGDAASETSEYTDTDSLNSGTEDLEHNKDQETDLNDIHCNIGSEADHRNGPDEKSPNSEGGDSLDHRESAEEESLVETENPSFLAGIRAMFRPSDGPCFPYWCVYLGWVLCILTTLLSAVFTLFYSMMWGREQSNMWLTTMAISFVQDTLISQPFKVLIVSLIFAMYFKSPSDDDFCEESSVAIEDDDKVTQDLTNEELAQYDPPDSKLLKMLRIREIKRRQTIKLFTDLCVYVILLAMVMILSFQYRNPASYKMINALKRVFVDPVHNSSLVRFDQVNSVNSIWDWTSQTLVPGLHPGPLYEGLQGEPYIADRMSLQLGVARLRQVRVQKGTCEVNKWFKGIFSECNGFYSMSNDDTKLYAPRWKNGREKTEKKEKRNVFSFSSRKLDHNHTSWEHINNFEAHHVLPVIGKFSTYSGGGYVINLNKSVNVDQQQLSWLDSRSRAVHAEFVAYNPTINMVAAVTVTFELPPLGGVFKSFEAFTVSMYGSLRKHPAARIIGEVIATIVLIVMIFRVALTIFHDKCEYFKDVGKILDLVFVLTGIVIVFLRTLKEGFKKLATDQFNENPKQFLDFYQCGFYDELTDYSFAFLNFIAIVRFSVFLRFLGCLEHILKTIARCFYDLMACLLVFFCLMMAFSSLFSIAFNSDSENFKDFPSSLQTSVSYMARMVRSNEAVMSQKVVRAVALFSCCLTLIFFYLTVIRSVFIVGYRKTLIEDRGKQKEQSFEAGIFEIFVDKIFEITGIEKEKEVVVEEEDPLELRLRSQKNYIDKSQFRRLRLLINEAYTDDVLEDLNFLEVMGLDDEFQNAVDKGIKVSSENTNLMNEMKITGSDENNFKNVHDDKGRDRHHVRFKLPGDSKEESAGNKAPEKFSKMPDETDKLNLLEKLVEEKMRTLQRKRESSLDPNESGSVEREIQMLFKVQQRIEATRRKTLVTLPSQDSVNEKDCSSC